MEKWRKCSDDFITGHDESPCLPPCQRTRFRTILMEKTDPQEGKPYVTITILEKYVYRKKWIIFSYIFCLLVFMSPLMFWWGPTLTLWCHLLGPIWDSGLVWELYRSSSPSLILPETSFALSQKCNIALYWWCCHELSKSFFSQQS